MNVAEYYRNKKQILNRGHCTVEDTIVNMKDVNNWTLLDGNWFADGTGADSTHATAR